jgi:DNA-binding NtrC family response regulator
MRPTNGESDDVAGSRVLVVDDDPSITRLVRRALGSHHQVFEYNDARLAYEAIAAGARFDLVVCDVRMPHLSGEGFYRAVLGISPALAARIVFLTGASPDAPGAAFLHDTVHKRFTKPFNVREFRTAVADLIRESGRWKAARDHE